MSNTKDDTNQVDDMADNDYTTGGNDPIPVVSDNTVEEKSQDSTNPDTDETLGM